jgi:hypothetical protein
MAVARRDIKGPGPRSSAAAAAHEVTRRQRVLSGLGVGAGP